MPRDAQGNWYDDPADVASGFAGGSGPSLPEWFRNLTGGGQAQAAPAPAPPPEPEPEAPVQGPTLMSRDEQQAAAEDEFALKQAAADLAQTEARTRQIEAELAKATDPAAREAARINLEAAKVQLEQARVQLERLKSQMSPEAAARLEHELALARDRMQREFTASENAADREARATEAREGREFTAGQNQLNRQANVDIANQSLQVNLRQQELDRLKAQDDWVLGVLRQQVAEGTLSLQKATSIFNAYVERAKLPTQIMQNVSQALAPVIPYLTNSKRGDAPPGFEKGGPVSRMIERSGGKYDAKTYAYDPVKINMFQLAKKAGANFKESGKVPDPEKLFGGINVPQTPSNLPSAAATTPLPTVSPLPGGTPQAAAPPVPVGPVPSMVPAAPGMQMTPDEEDRLRQLILSAPV